MELDISVPRKMKKRAREVRPGMKHFISATVSFQLAVVVYACNTGTGKLRQEDKYKFKVSLSPKNHFTLDPVDLIGLKE